MSPVLGVQILAVTKPKATQLMFVLGVRSLSPQGKVHVKVAFEGIGGRIRIIL